MSWTGRSIWWWGRAILYLDLRCWGSRAVGVKAGVADGDPITNGLTGLVPRAFWVGSHFDGLGVLRPIMMSARV